MAKPTYRVKRFNSATRPQLKALVVWNDDAGKRNKKFFETVKEAETFAQHRETELLNQGREALNFPSALRIMAQRCDALLAPFGKTIEDATLYFICELKKQSASCALERVLLEFLAQKKAQGVCNQYYGTLRTQLGAFVAVHRDRLACEITMADCNAFLATREVGAIARNFSRLVLVCFFNFAMHSGYCTSNPAQKTTKAKVTETTIGVLTPEAPAQLLEAACPQTLAFLAIGAFAGVRVAEMQRLDWSEIDFEDGFIEIRPEKSKTAQRRLIRIQPCLRSWLEPLAKLRGPVFTNRGTMWNLMQATRERAGLKEWPKNALRHSFASYHLAHFKDANGLALEMGHAGCHMIFSHYRQIVRPADALRFWNILPADQNNVLRMAEANEIRPDGPPQPRGEAGSHPKSTGRPFITVAPWKVGYEKSQREYAALYGVSRVTIQKWQDLERPLDHPEAMAKLRGQRYDRPLGEYAATYGKGLNTIKNWAKAGWPLDNPELMRAYMARKAAKKKGKVAPSGKALRLLTLPEPVAAHTGERSALAG